MTYTQYQAAVEAQMELSNLSIEPGSALERDLQWVNSLVSQWHLAIEDHNQEMPLEGEAEIARFEERFMTGPDWCELRSI
jgi:hypothetical protein